MSADLSTAAAGPRIDTDLLQVRDLRVLTGRGADARVLVDGVTLSLAAGETLGVVGESGSGKSLLARSIVGLLPDGLHAEGSVQVAGLDVVTASERELRAVRGRRISLLMQDPFTMLNPLQRIGDTIRESVRPERRPSRREAGVLVEQRLAEVGLAAEVARSHPFELSGGMRQRAALAAALAGDPELLIADEPTTALDATTQAEMLQLLARLQQERGMALLLITHDLDVAFSVCDRIAVTYAGAVLETGPTGQLHAGPQHPYTLGLLLSEVSAEHFTEQLSSIPGSVPKAADVRDVCRFAARCTWSREACTAGRPPLRELARGTATACVRIEEIGDEMAARRAVAEQPGQPRTSSAEGPAVLRVEDLRKTYRSDALVGRGRTTTALRGVSFGIAEGESVGLVGESGSGKTTIARAVVGLHEVDGTRLDVDGMPALRRGRLSRADRRRLHQTVQMVFQDPYASLNPRLPLGTVLEEALSFRPAGAGARPSAGDLLESVGLPAAYLARRPHALSGGERQRVAIARALAVRPRLLVCDEPVAALDVSVQAQVLELLRRIREEQGTAMLFITHDLSVVRQMTDRVVVLYRGEVVETGQTDAVLDRPGHPYTARLVASVPGAPPA